MASAYQALWLSRRISSLYRAIQLYSSTSVLSTRVSPSQSLVFLSPYMISTYSSFFASYGTVSSLAHCSYQLVKIDPPTSLNSTRLSFCSNFASFLSSSIRFSHFFFRDFFMNTSRRRIGEKYALVSAARRAASTLLSRWRYRSKDVATAANLVSMVWRAMRIHSHLGSGL